MVKSVQQLFGSCGRFQVQQAGWAALTCGSSHLKVVAFQIRGTVVFALTVSRCGISDPRL